MHSRTGFSMTNYEATRRGPGSKAPPRRTFVVGQRVTVAADPGSKGRARGLKNIVRRKPSVQSANDQSLAAAWISRMEMNGGRMALPVASNTPGSSNRQDATL